jgi:hypothetical protein
MLALIRVAKIHGYEWRHRTVVAGQHGGIEQYWQDNMAAIAQIIVHIKFLDHKEGMVLRYSPRTHGQSRATGDDHASLTLQIL